MEFINVHILCTSDRERTAKELRDLADQIERGEKPSIRNCGIRAFTRDPVDDDTLNGEHAIEGRYYAVCSNADTISDPCALFREKESAEAYAKLIEGYLGEADHNEVCRVDLFGSLYNGIDNDPHENVMRWL